MSTVSDRLKVIRKKLGYSQQAIADEMGVSKRAIQVYESGSQTPGGNALEGYAKLGVNMNWLFTGEGEPLMESLEALKHQPTGELDDELLALVIARVNTHIGPEDLEESKRARLITNIYEEMIVQERESGAKTDKHKVDRVVKLVFAA